MMEKLSQQFILTVTVILIILSLILLLITHVIRRFNMQIVQLTQSAEEERRAVFEKATGQMFENIYELDVSNNCQPTRLLKRILKAWGLPRTSFDEALRIIAQKQIRKSSAGATLIPSSGKCNEGI
ncbi:MAG: hypothetical protein ACLVJO_04015 [[Clostridium] scindens]